LSIAKKYLQRREWSELYDCIRQKCSSCGGIAPYGAAETGERPREFVSHEPRGHHEGCELALAIKELGGIVVWRDFWAGEVRVNEYAGMSFQEALDQMMYKHLSGDTS